MMKNLAQQLSRRYRLAFFRAWRSHRNCHQPPSTIPYRLAERLTLPVYLSFRRSPLFTLQYFFFLLFYHVNLQRILYDTWIHCVDEIARFNIPKPEPVPPPPPREPTPAEQIMEIDQQHAKQNRQADAEELSQHCSDNDYTDDEGVTYTSDCLRLLKARITAKEYIVPEGTQIISAGAFLGLQVNHVQLPGSLRIIDYNAFCSSGIRQIVLPEGLETIGDWAFSWCMLLADITLPASLTQIGHNPFAYCGFDTFQSRSERFVMQDRALIDWQERRFIGYVEQHKHFGIRENPNTGKLEFTNDTPPPERTHCIIPDGVEILGDSAFRGQYTITELTIPASLRQMIKNPIADSAIKLIHNLSPHFSVHDNCLMDRDETILYAYYGSPKKLVIPKTVTTLSSCSLDVCPAETITLPAGLQTVSDEPFRGCMQLKKIIIPAGTHDRFLTLLPDYDAFLCEVH